MRSWREKFLCKENYHRGITISSFRIKVKMNSLKSYLPPVLYIENFFKIHGDKRVAELRFMDTPWEVLFISAFYVYFCYDLGPHRLMKNRPAFDLVWTVRIFNTFILSLNVWLLGKFLSLWGFSCLGCAVSIALEWVTPSNHA